MDLSNHDFSDADLSGVRFENCSFTDSKLIGVCLEDARFQQCRFIRIRVANCDLRDAVFEGCNFTDDLKHSGAVFAFGQLERTRFVRCDLSFASFERCQMYNVDMEGCNLRGATLAKADFSRRFGPKLTKWAGRLRSCNLHLADLSEIRMQDCELSGSRLTEADLTNGDLAGNDMRSCDLSRATMHGAKLARADIRSAKVDGLNLRELASYEGLKITPDQQFQLLQAIGLEISL